MGKFKVGDRVRVREDLEEGEDYGSLFFNEDMSEFKGKKMTIEKVDIDGTYQVREDFGEFWWTDEMLEKAEYTYEDLCNSPIRN